MHDLRIKVLRESGKTVSKKARSRPESSRASNAHTPRSSPAQSPRGSPGHSRAGSRYNSEDEDSESEDDESMTLSTNSATSDDLHDTRAPWSDRFQDRIAEMQDRKRSSVQGREETLSAYLHLIRHHFSQREASKSLAEILDALARSIRAGGSVVEQSLALRCLTTTVLTCPVDTIFDQVSGLLKSICRDDTNEKLTCDATIALSIAAVYGGASEEETEELLEFLVEVIESDGESAGIPDSATVVATCLQAWGFVACHMEDLSEQADRAMDAFVEQLDSTDVEVQTGAGFNIALIFEASRDQEEDSGEPFNLQYDPNKLIRRMKELSKQSTKSISRKDRRHLRTNFTSIITSLELGKGPGYSTAGRPGMNPHTGGQKMDTDTDFQEFGYRDKIRIREGYLVIDTWSLSARVEMLRSIFGGGFTTQFLENPLLAEDLSDAEMEEVASPPRRR